MFVEVINRMESGGGSQILEINLNHAKSFDGCDRQDLVSVSMRMIVDSRLVRRN